MHKRYVFFISDSTGITSQTLGNSLLSQFDDVEFEQIVIPYVDTESKARAAVERINQTAVETGHSPIIFDTVIDPYLNGILAQAHGKRFDILTTYLQPLEEELQSESSHIVGKAHGKASTPQYMERMDAVHFAMDNDDGAKTRNYDKADIILIGVSRCGKTPTSLYLALQYGIYAANYPITEEDLGELHLPKILAQHKNKLFGLTINPERLSAIRNERRADSRYASLRQCEFEVQEVEAMYRRWGIHFIDTTDISVEEIATKVLNKTDIKRRLKA